MYHIIAQTERERERERDVSVVMLKNVWLVRQRIIAPAFPEVARVDSGCVCPVLAEAFMYSESVIPLPHLSEAHSQCTYVCDGLVLAGDCGGGGKQALPGLSTRIT